MSVTRGLLVVVVLAWAACASSKLPLVEQRTTQGPMADDVWAYRILMMNGREPTFEERRHWEGQLDLAITRYLIKDAEFANSPQVSSFRLLRQASVGMSKEQVLILLDAPEQTTTDVAEMEKLARKYWPQIRGKASEVWTYPLGWHFYFSEARVVDIVQYQPRR